MTRNVVDWLHHYRVVPWLVTLILLPIMLWPVSWWFKVDRVYVNSAQVSSPLAMIVDRKITRPFYGEWYVTIRQWNGNGWVTYCNAEGSSNYHPKAVLPKDLSLRWWTDGQCHPLPVGKYQISTTWVVKPEGFLTDKSISIDSNIFEVR